MELIRSLKGFQIIKTTRILGNNTRLDDTNSLPKLFLMDWDGKVAFRLYLTLVKKSLVVSI